MFKLAVQGVRFNGGRYLATLIAIMTGIAFFAATGFIGDRVVDALEGDVDRQYGNVDVAVVVDTDSTDTQFAEGLRIPGAAADKILAVDGVEAGGGELTAPVAFLGENGKPFGEGTTGRLWIEDDQLNPLKVTEGNAPSATGEIAVDAGTAERESIAVGDTVTVLSVGGKFDATVVGLTKFGSTDAVDDGGTVSIPASAAFDWLNSGRVEYDNFYVRGSATADDIASFVPRGFVAQTGAEFREDKRSEVGSVGRFLKQGLQFFALLALFVGGFVIYNTFSVIVAQRQRELAVLAAVGATPKQLKRSLRYEGLVIGLLGSILGVLAGIGLMFLMVFVLEAFGIALPGSGIKIAPNLVVQAVFLGTLITFLCVTIPARRAAKTEPIEALRDAAAEAPSLSRGRGIVALVMVVLGLGGLFLGGSAPGIGFGALLLIVGVIVGGPYIAVAGARIARPVMARFGLEGRLATDNSARNPKRTATTSNALLIGVFLVTFVTVAGTSLKDFVVAEIQKLDSADYIVSSNGGTIDADLVAQLREVEGVDNVTTLRRESVTIDGKPSQLATADLAALTDIANVETSKGSLDDLGPGKIAVLEPEDSTIDIGSKVSVANADGKTEELEVAALLEASLDVAQIGNIVDTATFDGLVGETAPTVAFIDATSGDQTDTQDRIEEVVAERPDISVAAGNAVGRLISGIFSFLINAVNGLLLMSVVVALIGIVNTLSLSILERRRELGLLRVVGMTDKRVQRMVRLESGLIASLGTVTGILLGLAVGWGVIASIDRLSDASIGLAFPGLYLLAVLVLGVGLGFLASIIPARRSTRLEVLDAIQVT
jgi:putative ABC transport system permease protein